jgi:SAM-dependent methyltransferase
MNQVILILKGAPVNQLDMIQRTQNPAPWSEGDKIPWNDPAFSQRMLREHLSQEHDAASRRFEIIDQHCAWIHEHLLGGRPSHVLDLGCGPGLYAQRLARLGHACTGLDFSPASIEYAREQSRGLECRFELVDLRSADFGNGFDLVMLIFGEFNVFRPDDSRRILQKAQAALKPGGQLLLEVHTYDKVRTLGQQPPTWFSSPGGLFSDRPHLCLMESFWHADQSAAVQRYYIIDAQSGEVTQMNECMQGYSDSQYCDLLSEFGFRDITFHPSLAGSESTRQEGLFVLSAVRA